MKYEYMDKGIKIGISKLECDTMEIKLFFLIKDSWVQI